jgi:hypothetical protein
LIILIRLLPAFFVENCQSIDDFIIKNYQCIDGFEKNYYFCIDIFKFALWKGLFKDFTKNIPKRELTKSGILLMLLTGTTE